MKCFKLNFHSFIRTLDNGKVSVLITATRDFFRVTQGPIMDPCPNTKYIIFSEFDKTNSELELENKFKMFSIIIINFSFIWMFFFHYMTTCNVLKYWDTYK